MALERLAVVTSLLILLLAGFPSPVSAEGAALHIVQPGETLRTIAAQHGITTRALINANNLKNPDLVLAGQKLLIPASSGSVPAPEARPAPAQKASRSSYTVRLGQTLSQVGGKFGVSSAAIAKANGIKNPDLIQPGQELIIPKRASDTAKAQQGAGTRFVASISQQRCWLYQDGQLVGDWRCSSGRKSAPTAPGSYKIQSNRQIG